MPIAMLAVRYVGAAIDFVPLLIIAYVVYAIIASLIRVGRQARTQAQGQPQPQVPVGPGATPAQTFTADQVRAALAKRRAALQAAPPPKPVASRPLQAAPVPAVATGISALSPPAPVPSADAMQTLQLLTAPGDAAMTLSGTGAVDLRTAMAGIPPAALAIIASAIIGPCAAHRGAGHQPEDW
jgi:hypothetical protein